MWEHVSAIRDEAVQYAENRLTGKIKSMKTSWSKFNDATLDGLEWGSIVTLAAPSGGGKTAIANAITRDAEKNNPGQDISVLDFQFEMSNRNTGIREYSKAFRIPVKQLLSADKNNPITQSDINKMRTYNQTNQLQQIYQISKAMNCEQIAEQVELFAKATKGKPFVVTIDHSILIRRGMKEKDKFETLYVLGETLTDLKRLYNVLFIILTQVNRDLDKLERKIPGTLGNFPCKSDIWGADSLFQHSDLVIACVKPALQGISYYGPDNYVVSQDLLAMHFLKSRNGIQSLLFFESNFEYMDIKEIPTPARAVSTISTGGRRTQNKNNP